MTASVIIILSFLIYLLYSFFSNWSRSNTIDVKEVRNDRTVEEIMEGKTFYELREELMEKDLEDLSENELQVLYFVITYLEQNNQRNSTV